MLLNLFTIPPDSLLYTGQYNLVQVLLSLLAAVLGSYTALLVAHFASRLPDASTRRRWAWTVVGAVAMGSGVWAMHFVGMQAYSLPCTVGYNPWVTALSGVPAFLASVVAIRVLGRGGQVRPGRVWLGGILMAVGIGGMHYTGMAAYRLDGFIRYDALWFVLSLGVAVLLACAALWARVALARLGGSWAQRSIPLAAVAMGLAVSGMHYTAMLATRFVQGPASGPNGGGAALSPEALSAMALGLAGVLCLVAVVMTLLSQSVRRGLRARLGLLFVLATLWGVLAWVGSSLLVDYWQAQEYARGVTAARQSSTRLANQLEGRMRVLRNVTRWFSQKDSVRAALGTHAHTPAALRGEVAAQKTHWAKFAAINELNWQFDVFSRGLEVKAIWAINADGDVVMASNAGTEGSFVGTNVQDRLYFQEAVAGRAGVHFDFSRALHMPGLYIAEPVVVSGRFVGAVVMKYELSEAVPWLKDAHGFIADPWGVVVASHDEDHLLRLVSAAGMGPLSAAQQRERYQSLLRGPMPTAPWAGFHMPKLHLQDDGQRYVAYSMPLAPFDLMLTVHEPMPLWAEFASYRSALFAIFAVLGMLLTWSVAATVMHVRTLSGMQRRLLRKQGRLTRALRDAIAARRQANESAALTQAVLDSTTAAIVQVAADDRIVLSNRFAEELFRAPAGGLQGVNYHELYAPSERKAMADRWHQLQQNKVVVAQAQRLMRRHDGSTFWGQVAARLFTGADGTMNGAVVVIVDVSAEREREEKVRYLALHDPLTGLPNRACLMERADTALKQAQRNGRHLALLFLDLNGFKLVNDTHGHEAGDWVLRSVAERLRGLLRVTDTVCRQGGDEFVILVPEFTDMDKLLYLAEKVRDAIAVPYAYQDAELHISTSIGIATFPTHADSLPMLLQRADAAMYQAKQEKEARIRVAPERSEHNTPP